jgi:4-aminobutyrate aminotransferase-like enzyme
VVAPPLIVTREELDHGLEVLDRALALADARADPEG